MGLILSLKSKSKELKYYLLSYEKFQAVKKVPFIDF